LIKLTFAFEGNAFVGSIDRRQERHGALSLTTGACNCCDTEKICIVVVTDEKEAIFAGREVSRTQTLNVLT
jgi:hypothetical protein